MIDERSYRDILEEAYKKNPSSSFVTSCAAFYGSNRFLTQKQIDALDNIRPAYRTDGPDCSHPEHINYVDVGWLDDWMYDEWWRD